ncbi:Metalloregulation DNA-binding stress protein [Paraliobacillus sp. PM-2]|uniref:Dps family protein n=1 Tax=Paraliobacillus sp. PM-2 TaxID=1462524 RepID=UPI00061C1034|nr:ferritin-like domain-containing protein [Paraliobacillus sp. PM-2]CQR47615.1 Metalloregulation DNA-binding stress protein [Paraliobacillus sp. PM-2]
MRNNENTIRELNQLLADLFVLYTKLHRYRWYIKGKNIFTLRKLFQEYSGEISADIDVVATRILALGGQPFATMDTFIKHASLEEAQADDEELEIIKQLLRDFQAINSQLTRFLNDSEDHPTTDVFVKLSMKYSEKLWLLQAYLD